MVQPHPAKHAAISKIANGTARKNEKKIERAKAKDEAKKAGHAPISKITKGTARKNAKEIARAKAKGGAKKKKQYNKRKANKLLVPSEEKLLVPSQEELDFFKAMIDDDTNKKLKMTSNNVHCRAYDRKKSECLWEGIVADAARIHAQRAGRLAV